MPGRLRNSVYGIVTPTSESRRRVCDIQGTSEGWPQILTDSRLRTRIGENLRLCRQPCRRGPLMATGMPAATK